MVPPRAPASGLRRPTLRFTLRQIEAFAMVAQHGSVSAAARQLARTQSAVSMALQELEQALGLALFERRGRRLLPTEASERLLPRAIEMMDRAYDIGGLGMQTDTPGTPLAIGASRTIGPYLIPTLTAGLQQLLPGLRLAVVVANTEELLGRIRSLELDGAFVEGDVTDSDLLRRPWLRDQLCIIARRNHPLFKRRPPLAQLAREATWVLRERGSGSREIFLRAIEQRCAPLDIAVEINDPEAQKRLVAQTDWLSCISRRALLDDGEHSGVREIDWLPRDLRLALQRRFWLIQHPQRYASEALRQLIGQAESMMKTTGK